MELGTAVTLSIGALIVDKVTGFTPGELSSDVGRRLRRPKEEVLREVIEYCTELVWIGALWSTTSVLYTKADTSLIIALKKPFAPMIAEVLAERTAVAQ